MKILGISGSPRNETTSRLVRHVLAGAGGDTEFVSLAGKSIGPCTACLGCVRDNACVLKDDMASLRESILAADAYVIGAANYYSTLNALSHCFLERWYQFRHRECDAVTGKLAVAVGVGGSNGKAAADAVEDLLRYNLIETVGKVTVQGAACCFTCGYGESCRVGAIHMMFGPDVKITEEITPSLAKQPDAVLAAKRAGVLLSQRLAENVGRPAVAARVMADLGARFKDAT